MLPLLWLIPLLPFAGALLNGVLLRDRLSRRGVTAVACGSVAGSLLAALAAVAAYAANPAYAGGKPFELVVWSWLPAGLLRLPGGLGELSIDLAFLLDPLSSVMLLVVTLVGFLIHVYSVGYMGHEEGYQRFFAYMNLFMGAMLLLVLGNNFLVTFVGWEGVGLCSYLLIGFYYDQEFPPHAGRKAFIVNRVGDFAFLVGLFALASRYGTLNYTTLFGGEGLPEGLVQANVAGATEPYLLGLSFAAFVALCLFIGAMGKSAQIPLYVWLPDAMAGPTPVSALIHAATMVTAGVYMVVRSNVLYQLSPGVSLFVAGVGAATALFAATIGLAQDDIKKVLAYSTVSQLGYMFLGAGVGAYTAAIFHLGTHAFFKALLFLAAGSVIHAMSGEQDIRKMGGLAKHLPATYGTFLVATVAIAGIPPLSGFFSKDEILAGAFAGHHYLLWGVGLLTAGLTACYMWRLLTLTFWGGFRGTEAQHHHLHESPRVMTVPLVLLAVGAVTAGWIGIPSGMTFHAVDLNWLHHWLEPVVRPLGGEGGGHALSLGVEWALILGSVAVAVAGILVARSLWGRRGVGADDAFAEKLPRVQRTLSNKYWVDELYDTVVIRPLAAVARFSWKVVDTLVIDGSLHVGAFLTEITGDLGRFSTTGNVRNYALYFFAGLLLLFWWMVL
ncbi:MAG TPA: NADH-quinone oxidoreductase subunit L [Thermoanaerobaculia bacterium]|nr:NADH-quinone oxidoreductase subunit L [Thermoanaerobaculia bacterium]